MQSTANQDDPIKNVKLVTTEEFKNLLGYDGNFLKEFNNIQELEQVALDPRASEADKREARVKLKELKILALDRMTPSDDNFLGAT